jgi:hypothetical protein
VRCSPQPPPGEIARVCTGAGQGPRGATPRWPLRWVGLPNCGC